MKIQQLNIHSYGRIKDKEIKFGDNINIIFGKNESGKSTIMHYIVNSFYGTSKNKKSRELSDYDKYLPWSSDDFSGRLSYKLDNGEKFEIYRDFNKKNPKIYNELKEDISNKFNIDKSLGNQFFYEQTKVDEDLFLSTVVSNQQEVKLGKTEQGVLIQKIANLVGTGDDNTSFRIAMDRINRRQLDEIGTSRSREKPINIIQKKLTDLQEEKNVLEKYKNSQYEIEEKILNKKEEISDLESEMQMYKDIKNVLENLKSEQEKINLQKQLKSSNSAKISEYDFNIDKIQEENKNLILEFFENKRVKKEKNDFTFFVSIFVLILINILQFVFLKNAIVKISICCILLVITLVSIFAYFRRKKQNEEAIKKHNEKQKKAEIIKEKINLIEDEIKKLERENNNIEKNIKSIEEKIEEEKRKKLDFIYIKYHKNINEDFLNIKTLEQIQFKIQLLQEKISNTKVDLHRFELDKSNIEPQLDKLANIEEEIELQKEKKQQLEKLNMSFELAKTILTKCYENMKETVTPKFTQNLSQNIADITNNKYKNVNFNEQSGLVVETEKGDYVSASHLSVGTIEQLYLSLRLSMIKDLSSETLPIILDEAFAYFDDERLTNFLETISKKYKENQILIFTCTDREQQILKDLGGDYNLVIL